jgi:hypothetical protein
MAQVRLGEWGYGVKFNGEANAETVAAIRLYQHRNGLPETGRIDGLTTIQMENDEKAIKEYPFTLPFFYFPEKWSTSYFMAEGAFHNLTDLPSDVSGPVRVRCVKEYGVCIEEESALITPDITFLNITEWTDDHIVAEDQALCYTMKLQIERQTKTIVHTQVKNNGDKVCKSVFGVPLEDITTNQLIDGFEAQMKKNKIRSEAVRRVKLFGEPIQHMLSEREAKK